MPHFVVDDSSATIPFLGPDRLSHVDAIHAIVLGLRLVIVIAGYSNIVIIISLTYYYCHCQAHASRNSQPGAHQTARAPRHSIKKNPSIPRK